MNTNTDQIIAHVDLIRSIDRLLTEADAVRKKREILDKLLADSTEATGQVETTGTGEAAHV